MQTIATAGKPVKAWIDGVEFDAGARRQVETIARLPFVHEHVAVMPDVHVGKGATIGSVIATIGAIVPAAVGVDIGCGMIAQKLTLRAEDLPVNLARVRSAIEKAVPVGKGAHRAATRAAEDAWTTRSANDTRTLWRERLRFRPATLANSSARSAVEITSSNFRSTSTPTSGSSCTPDRGARAIGSVPTISSAHYASSKRRVPRSSIAISRDAGMLDVVGFDAAAPALIADFARGA